MDFAEPNDRSMKNSRKAKLAPSEWGFMPGSTTAQVTYFGVFHMLKTRLIFKKRLIAFVLLAAVALASLPAISLGQGPGGGGTGGGGTGGTGGGGTGGTGGGGTGGGGAPGNDFNQQTLDLGEFEEIRRPRFAGVSRATAVHPYTRVGNSEAVQIQGNAATDAAGANGQGARTQNVQGAGNVGGMNQFNSPFGAFGGFSPFGFGGFGGQQAATPIRSTLSFNTTATSHLTAPTTQLLQAPVQNQALTSRIRSIPTLQNANVSVILTNRTAIVSGTVSSEEEKQRIGRVLKFEPGVSQVDNRLEVQQ